MKNQTFKKIMGILIIAFVLVLTIKFVKMLPAFMKILALGGNVATIYLVYRELIYYKTKNKEDEKTIK